MARQRVHVVQRRLRFSYRWARQLCVIHAVPRWRVSHGRRELSAQKDATSPLFGDDFRVDCELCRHWGLSRRTGAKQNCAGGVEERRGRSRFFAGAKQNGAGAKQNGGGEEEGVSWGCLWTNADKPP
ncbi:hypothetical protein Bbelb_181230 [Branchiostoma belcheri]|nr:hypothetical protein Bbelb_181230 [Branchiostoma belcheri]